MTFDIQEKRSDPQVLPWIERCVLSLRISDVGVAIPLQDVEIEAPFFGHPLNPELKARPAFLVSTPSLLFATSKGKAGIASISDLSAQFVQIFDQTKARDFSGYHHETRNRLLLPSSGLKIATDAATASRAKAFTVNAKMSGAQLDIDGSIVESVFQLIKLYEASYDRLARHAPDVAAQVDLTSAIGDKRSTDPKAEPDLASFFDTTSFEATFQVDSGVIRMHGAQNTLDSESQPGEAKKDIVPTVPAKPAPRRRNEQIAGHTSRSSVDNNPPDSFIIPKLTVWSVKKDSVGPDQPSNLHFDALIHSSRNILRPTLLPFLSEIADGVKLHMDEHAVPHRNADPAHSVTKSSAAPKEALAADAVSQEPASGQLVSSSLRHLCLSISLRIDKSSLQLNCGKIAPVSSGLDWQCGGLLVVIKPGQRSLQASVRVDEVGFDVRHA